MRSIALCILIAVSSAISIELQDVEIPIDQLLQDSIVQAEILKKDTAKTDQGFQDTTAADTLQYQAIKLQYDHTGKTFSLQDKAQLSYRGTLLEADTVFFNNKTLLLNAFGNPVITDGKQVEVHAYHMRYNIKKRIGQMYYGSLNQDKYQYNGMSIKRLPDGRLQITRGDFSTCDLMPDQDYYFYTRKMSYRPKEKMVAAPVVLNIKDVPIAVLPLMVSPTTKDASSGLIPPTPGGDQKQGFYLKGLGYYWAINEMMDFTATTDIIEGQHGTFPKNAIAGNYNYNVKYLLNGFVNGKMHFITSGGATYPYELDGWDVSFRHTQYLTPDKKTSLIGDGSFVSSTDIRGRNALEHEEVLNQQANAHITYRKQFKNNSVFTLETRQNRSLNKGKPNTTTMDLPDVKYSISGQFFEMDEDDLNDSLYEDKWYEKVSYSYSFQGNHNRTLKERYNIDTLYSNEISTYDSLLYETDTNRIGFKQASSINYSGKFMEIINVQPSISYTGYWTAYSYNNPNDSLDKSYYFDNDIAHGSFGDYYQTWSTSVNTNTKLYGIVKPNWGPFIGLRHVVTPNLGVTYQPKIDSSNSFVPNRKIHPSVLKQEKAYRVNMGLDNSFDIKYKTKKLSGMQKSTTAPTTDDQGNDLEDTMYDENELTVLNTKSNTSYNFAKDSLQWSPITSSVGLQFTKSERFSFNVRHEIYDPVSSEPNQERVPWLAYYSYGFSKQFTWSGNFNDGFTSKKYKYSAAPWDARLRYSYNITASRKGRFDNFNQEVTHSTSDLSINIRPTKSWNLNYTTNYDFDNAEFARHTFQFSRNLHCWQFQFNWTPVGPSVGWSFKIWVIDIPDIKMDVSNTEVKTAELWDVAR